MPAQVSYLDQEAVVTPPDGYLKPFPLMVMGPTGVQNDLRVLFVSGSESASGGVSEAIQMQSDPPTGFTQAYALAPDFETRGVYYRPLVTGDADTSVAWIKPTGWRDFAWALLTVRGVDPATAPAAGDLTQLMTHNVQDSTLTVASVSVPAAGEMLFCLWMVADPEGNWPSWAGAMGVPSGGTWAHVSATDKSGNTFDPQSTDPSLLVIGKRFAAAGSTGSVTVPCSVGSHAFAGMYAFFRPAPDAVSVAGGATATATAGASASSSTTNPVSIAGPATAQASAGQAFNGVTGYGISDPLILTGLPVTASVVEWTAVAGSAGSTQAIETSINGGASWDTAINGAAVPRLVPGDTATLNVLVRVTQTRLVLADTSPKLTYLRLAVTDDASTVELVPVGHGAVDKVTRKRATTGGGSGGSGGPGVTGRGGGQSGGGRSLKVHAVDLSKLVSANTWGSAFVIQTSENVVDAALRFLLNRLPGQTQFRLCTTTRVTVEPFIYGLSPTDPWKDLKEFLQPYGLECFFDASGVFVIRQIPDPAFGVPVWTIDDDAHPVITDLTDELTTEQTINYVTVKGEGTSTKNAVNAIAFDDNPLSDTYILSDFGIHAVTITIPGLETEDQAQTAADAILAGSLSGSQVITVSMVPNPALEPGDLVALDLEDIAMSGTFLVNGSTWSPAQTDTMQLICARQTSAA